MALACNEVVPRLVAWQDGELSRSESVQLEEHVSGCASCARSHHRLALTLPLPPLPPPDAVRRRLAAALDVDAILAAAEEPEAPALAPSWIARCWRSIVRPSSVPFGAVLVYLSLLAATFGWGASNWWALRQAQPTSVTAARPGMEGPVDVPGMDRRGPADRQGPHPGVHGEIPAHQFRPAAYDPEIDGSMSGDPAGSARSGTAE
jgi:anti-sigma factor RsiW